MYRPGPAGACAMRRCSIAGPGLDASGFPLLLWMCVLGGRYVLYSTIQYSTSVQCMLSCRRVEYTYFFIRPTRIYVGSLCWLVVMPVVAGSATECL
ncbi:hypothetical protein BZA05DRAFT_241550 [Tricharina praecox]|uniref:uncharacterized protein n=1 Tax=Tricharina praecox TaxID=43433 RepID=UPI002220B905|nr:uncharacterized protein BZA05DRAFT_241550 [Tricharina praecox]KAI5855506.1 hypothetical protein BZA05DRAFT_241550 [Tricharina praecox]